MSFDVTNYKQSNGNIMKSRKSKSKYFISVMVTTILEFHSDILTFIVYGLT